MDGGNGELCQRGKTLSGYFAMRNEYTSNGRRTYRSKHFKTISVARKWVKRFNARMDLAAIGEIDPVPYPTAIEEFLSAITKNQPLAITRNPTTWTAVTRRNSLPQSPLARA